MNMSHRSYPTEDDAILRASGLGRRFFRRKGLLHVAPFDAVHSMDLVVRRKDFVAVIGESGCGKTTLSRMLIGMLAASDGKVQVRIAGEWRDVASLSPPEEAVFRRNVQMVYQESDLALDPMSPVIESVLEGYRVNWPGVSRLAARRLAARLLHELGLEAREWRSLPSSMSGGERKRAVVARAFAALGYGIPAPPDPLPGKLLIADEPTAGLDCATQARLLQFFLDRQDEQRKDGMNLAYVLISHDLALVRGFSRSVVVMFGGRAVERGATKVLWPDAEPKGRFMHPYSQELMGVLTSTVEQPALPDEPGEGCIFRAECPHRDEKGRCAADHPWEGSPDHQWACWKAEQVPSVESD